MGRGASTSIATAHCSKRTVELIYTDKNQPQSVLRVAVGVVIDADGRVLIAQRPPGKTFAGSWEFPGGKIEPGEDRVAALARELREEIGITIGRPRPLIRITHHYAFGSVLLDTWIVREYQGQVAPNDGQPLRWVAQADLPADLLLPADGPIIAALQLPDRWVATAEHFRGQRGSFCRTAEDTRAAEAGGANFIVMQEALEESCLSALCASVSVPVYAYGVDIQAAWRLGATGVNEMPGLCRPVHISAA